MKISLSLIPFFGNLAVFTILQTQLARDGVLNPFIANIVVNSPLRHAPALPVEMWLNFKVEEGSK